MSSDKPTNEGTGNTTPEPVKLGGYPNDPAEYEGWLAERSKAVARDAGDYVLQMTPQYRHWKARRKDGKPMPKALDGTWSSPGHFKDAAERFEAKQGAVAKQRANGAAQ